MATAQDADAGSANGTEARTLAVPNGLLGPLDPPKERLATAAGPSGHGLSTGVAMPATACNAALTWQ